jgi:hypothetical protein
MPLPLQVLESPAHQRVRNALLKAAERIGTNAMQAGLYKIRRNRAGKVIHGYTLTPEHVHVLETLSEFDHGKISGEEAMAALHEYDVLRTRTKGY